MTHKRKANDDDGDPTEHVDKKAKVESFQDIPAENKIARSAILRSAILNDEEREEMICQPRKNFDNISKKTYSKEDEKALIDAFVWTLVKSERKQGEPARPGKPKTFRKERPPPEIEHAWRHVQQNTPEWMEIRSGSTGASSLQRALGWDSYVHNVHAWMEDMGMVGQPEKSIDDMFGCDLGHRDEDLSRRLTELLTGAEIKTTGVWLHPKWPATHASPDGNPRYPDNAILLNKHLLHDSLRGLWENKCSIYWALLNKLGAKHWGFPHAIRPYHVIQMQGQAACVSPRTEWTDYTSFWKFSEKSPLVLSHDGRAGAEGAEANAEATASAKFGEMLISRVYASQPCANFIYAYWKQHKKAVETKTQPAKVLYHVDDGPSVKWIPLIHCIWYMDGYPAELVNNPHDPEMLLNPPAERPAGWKGAFPPTRRVKIELFYDQPPLSMKFHEFAAML